MKIKDLSRKLHSFIQRIKKIPWIAFIFRIAEELGKDNAGDMAASIAYYAFLSIFPLLLGIIAVLGIFLPSETVQTYIFDYAEQYLPNSIQIIERNIDMIIEARGTLGVVSIIGLFWTGSAIFEAIGRAVNRAWNITKKRPYFIRKLRILLMSFSTGILFLISMAANTFSSIIPRIDLPVLDSLAIIVVRLTGFILLFIVITLLFRYMPNTKTSWRYIWPGAIFTTILFELARSIFTFYLSNFASYDMVYGSLAAIVILLVWIYFSALIFIIGAEFSSEFTRLRSRAQI